MSDRSHRSPARGSTGTVLAWLPMTMCAAGLGAVGFLSTGPLAAPVDREITVRAKKYEYDPAVIRVNRGDTVRLSFVADDVVHGFYLEGYDLRAAIVPQRPEVELRGPSVEGGREWTEEAVFTADREGKFRYRCSMTCGFLHPFMLGELIVGPNRLLRTGVGTVLGMLLGGFVLAVRRGRER